MKFAVFGDIHGNIEALKAAYEAAQARVRKRFTISAIWADILPL